MWMAPNETLAILVSALPRQPQRHLTSLKVRTNKLEDNQGHGLQVCMTQKCEFQQIYVIPISVYKLPKIRQGLKRIKFCGRHKYMAPKWTFAFALWVQNEREGASILAECLSGFKALRAEVWFCWAYYCAQTVLTQCLIGDTSGCKRNGGLSKTNSPSLVPENLTENYYTKNLRDVPSLPLCLGSLLRLRFFILSHSLKQGSYNQFISFTSTLGSLGASVEVVR